MDIGGHCPPPQKMYIFLRMFTCVFLEHHYARVKEETKQMQEELGEAMQYTADQKEVVFLYEGEERKRPRHDGKYIVEMKKQRPAWFAKNLLQKRNS